MILQELTLRNWRGFRPKHTFRFDEGFNLVLGRNEAGKSTLFEALTRALFDRYSSKAEEIKRTQPLGSSLNPEVEVVFRTNGRRYKVFKRFLGQSASQLFSERDGRWELDHEGDKADTELRTILRGEAAGRAAKAEHRGLAQALWYLQREEALPERAWTDSIKQGISGLVKLVPKSAQEDRILHRVEVAYSEYFTPTGRAKSGTELASLKDNIPQLEQSFDALRTRAEGVESRRSDLEGFTEAKSEKNRSLQEAQSDLGTLQQALNTADTVEEQRRDLEKAVQDADEKFRRIGHDHETIMRRIKESEGLGEALETTKSESGTLNADARQEQLAAQRHHEKWKRDYEPALQKLEGDLGLLLAVERLRKLEREKDRLRNHLSKVTKAREELQEKKLWLAKTSAPSRKEWTEFQENLTDLRVVEAQAKASAIRVGFDLKDKAAKVTATPKADRTPDGGEFLVTEPTMFSIQRIGRMRVRGGGASIEDLDAKAKELRSVIKATLDRSKVDDQQALSDLHQSRLDLEKDIKQLQKALDDLTNQEKDPEDELERTETGVDQESIKVKAAPQGWKAWGGKQIREKADELEGDKRRLIKLIEEEQEQEQKANKALSEGTKKAAEASNREAALQSQIKSLGKENAEILKTYGTVEHLAALVTQAKNELNGAKDAMNTIMKDYEARVELPRKLHQQGVDRVADLEKQLAGVQHDIVRCQAHIEEAAAQSLYTQYADLEATLEENRRRLQSLERRAEAARLLRDMVVAYRKEQSAALAGPVGALVNKWLTVLTEEAYDELTLDEELLPIGVHSSRYGERLPLESLSYGTHEQVIVLLRLAIGVLLSKDERNLVVIDDRLVNADPIRMKRLCLILQDAASMACQVVVATCNDTPYAGIGGTVIRVPSDGEESAA